MLRFSVKKETEVTGSNKVCQSIGEIIDEVVTGIINGETVTVTPLGEPNDETPGNS